MLPAWAPAAAPRARRSPALEVADIFRAHGAAYRHGHGLSRAQRRAMQAIETCRTAALGGHRETCDTCGAERIAYNSCRNRHCPKCQTLAKERWLAARRAELLPVEYFHVVFTLPHGLNALAQGNPRVVYSLLFRAAAATLTTFARDPRHLEATSAARRSSTPGARISPSTCICTVSSPAARSPRTARAGSPRRPASSSPSAR